MSSMVLDCFEPCTGYYNHAPPAPIHAALAAIAFLAGTAISAAVTVFSTDGPRRALAIATMFCLALFGLNLWWSNDEFAAILVFVLIMLLLVSVVYWPTRSQWINLPLVLGSGIASVSMVMLVIEETTRHY